MKKKTQIAIAAELGISRQALSDWKRSGMDTSAANIAALREKAGVAKSRGSVGEEIQRERLRKLKAEASQREHDLEIQQGKYILAADAESEGMRFGMAAKRMWEEIEDSLPPMLEGLSALQMKTKLREFASSRVIDLHEFFPE